MTLPEPSLFADGFESADMSATNKDGFAWGNNNRTSVVSETAAVWNNAAIDNPAPRGADWTPYEGEHSLRFRYAAGEAWSEQRFDLGGSYEELWFRYWLRVPINYEHGLTPDNPTANNNKFFALWMDDYEFEADGATMVWQMRANDSGGTSVGVYAVQNTAAVVDGGRHTGEIGYAEFISVPDDRGRWMQIVIHARAASSAAATDGLVELWRRWEDEQTFTLHYNNSEFGLGLPADGPQGWSAGYILGWANGAYAENTEWLVDLFEVSETPLIPQ